MAEPTHKLVNWPYHVLDVLFPCCQCLVAVAGGLQLSDCSAEVLATDNVVASGVVADTAAASRVVVGKTVVLTVQAAADIATDSHAIEVVL